MSEVNEILAPPSGANVMATGLTPSVERSAGSAPTKKAALLSPDDKSAADSPINDLRHAHISLQDFMKALQD